MKRSKHTLSHYRMHTLNMGELCPVQCVPVLPGDTMQGHTSALIRVSPLNTPVMHPVTARIHHWFVPNRILWPESEGGGFEQFITGGPDGNDSQTVPTIDTTSAKKSLLTYLGVPPTATPRAVNALAARAANKIFNQRYRDQDLVTERAEDDITVPRIAWEKDDITASRPWTQKGPSVTLPLGTDAPVLGIGVAGTPTVVSQGVFESDTSSATYADAWDTSNAADVFVEEDPDNANYPNIRADLSAAGAIDVNDFREAFAKQRYQEARARYGSRFVEYLRYIGIRPSDARLQEPEYLGGGTARLQFSEVLQTAGTTDGSGDGVGDLYGHGIAGVRTPHFRKFFEEHGFLITMLSVRPKSIYMNGVDREYLKQTKEDYFQKELANLGQQELKRGQVFLDRSTYQDAFSFQDRYDEYRRHPSMVGQDFRDTLNSWHLARELDVTAVLNDTLVECDPSDRIFQVGTSVADSLWVMCNNHLVARRTVPKRANPRIL